MTKKLTNDTQDSIKPLIQSGKSHRKIATILRLANSTVSRYAKSLNANIIENKEGRTKIVSGTTRYLIKRKVLNGGLKTAKGVYDYLISFDYDLSYKTAINVLSDLNFKASIKKKKI